MSSTPVATSLSPSDSTSVYVMVSVTIILQLIAVVDKFLSRLKKSQCCGSQLDLAPKTDPTPDKEQ